MKLISHIRAMLSKPQKPARTLPRLKTLDKYPLHRPTEEQAFLGYGLRLMPDHEVDTAYRKLQQTNLFVTFCSRIPEDSFGVIDRRVLCMVALLIDRPAAAILWAYTLHRLACQSETQEYYFAQFMETFQDGYPSTDSLHMAWFDQKDRETGTNYLDQKELWQ